MRTKFAVLFVLLALVAGMSVPASAGIGLGGAVSFPLWTEDTKEVHAGVTQMVTFSTTGNGAVRAFYKNGFLVAPKDSYGVFAEMQYLRMDPMVLGVKPEFIRKVDSGVARDYEGVAVSDGAVVINIDALAPDLYDIVTAVTQNQSRTDEGGIGPKLLQLFGRKTHHQISATDTVAAAFGVVDADRYIETFCRYQLGLDDPRKMTDDQKYLVKSVYFDSRLKGVVEFSEAVADYSWLSQGTALRVQGIQPPMSGDQPLDPALEAYKAENAGLVEQIRLLNERSAGLEEALKAAKQPEVAPTIIVAEPALQPATIEESLREKYAGKTGYIFYSTDPVARSWWLLSRRGWVRATNDLTITPVEEKSWLYDASDLARKGWIGFGFGEGNSEPTVVFPLNNVLNILEVR